MENSQVQYFANIIFTAFANNSIKECEQQAFDQIVKELKPSYNVLNKSNEFAHSSGFKVRLVGNYSTRVKNLEDMIYVAISDNELDDKQTSILQSCMSELGLEQKAADILLSEAENRLSNSDRQQETEVLDITSPIVLQTLTNCKDKVVDTKLAIDDIKVTYDNLQERFNFNIVKLKQTATEYRLNEMQYALEELHKIFGNLGDQNKQIILNALKNTKMPFDELFYLLIADNCEEMLKSSKYYIYHGLLNITGEQLKKLHKICLTELSKLGHISQDRLDEKVEKLEKNIKETA